MIQSGPSHDRRRAEHSRTAARSGQSSQRFTSANSKAKIICMTPRSHRVGPVAGLLVCPSGLLKTRLATSGAKARAETKGFIASLKRCATQNYCPSANGRRCGAKSDLAFLNWGLESNGGGQNLCGRKVLAKGTRFRSSRA